MALRYDKGIDDLLNVIFLLLAVAAFVVFFVVPSRTPFYILGGIAIVFRIAQYILRAIARKWRG
ncbi:MAG: hypothetical protein Q4D93_06745 [Porphyromonas sp.]|nr:hypothetical protein [Porphyromonas sp.]